MSGDRAPILVGVDGADHTRWAVEWAAREAALRKVPLRLVHAYIWPLLRTPPITATFGAPDGLYEAAKDILTESVELAHQVAPDVPLESELETSFPEELLSRESRNASYLVLGSRGLGRIGQILAGSVTTRLVVRAECPLVVFTKAPPEPSAQAPVVVGVDGSGYSVAALRTACDLAAHHGAALHVVHATPAAGSDGDEPVNVDKLVERWCADYPDLPIRTFVLDGRPDTVLIELSKGAQAVVVGARGRNPLVRVLVGSVSRTVLVRAECPVVVTPAGVHEPEAAS